MPGGVEIFIVVNATETRGQFNQTFTLVIYKLDHCIYKRRRK